MAMTRADYDKVADVILDELESGKCSAEEMVLLRILVSKFSYRFAQDNMRFDAIRFKERAGF